MHDEVGDSVGVFARGEGTEGVANYFHETGEGEGYEGPEAVGEDLDGVGEECEGEKDDGYDAECEIGGISGCY